MKSKTKFDAHSVRLNIDDHLNVMGSVIHSLFARSGHQYDVHSLAYTDIVLHTKLCCNTTQMLRWANKITKLTS